MLIAILSSNFHSTLEWARNELKVNTVNISRRFLKDDKENEYYIINNPEQAYGFKFDKYIKAPDFETLEDIVRSRIK